MDHSAPMPQSWSPFVTYLPHMRRPEEGSFATHDLEEHLRAVGDLPGDFASHFRHAIWEVAGLVHEIDK